MSRVGQSSIRVLEEECDLAAFFSKCLFPQTAYVVVTFETQITDDRLCNALPLETNNIYFIEPIYYLN